MSLGEVSTVLPIYEKSRDHLEGAKILWWLIQINAALWFLMLGTLAREDESLSNTGMAIIGLLFAGALEYISYKNIYKKYIRQINN